MYCSICDGYSVNANKAWMNWDWFYTTYGVFGDGGIITQSKGFTGKGIGKIGRSVRAYTYLVLTSQVQKKSNIVGHSASKVDAQQAFKSMFKALINEDHFISADIDREKSILEHE